jgi:uncharacterized membrane protein YjgN (DUF898 family)
MDDNHSSNSIESYPLIFSGRGGEYFRLWFVNVLLNIVTLGLYTPVARRRTARYFFDNTLVADSPLEFTGQLRKMVFGFLIFLALYAAYEMASRTGQSTAQGLLVLAGALFAPWIWGSAMRFRLRSTRWRGLQLQFQARWLDVYLASWPIFAMIAAWVLVYFAFEAFTPDLVIPPPRQGRVTASAVAGQIPTLTLEQWGLFALGVVMSVLCIIRLEFNFKSLLFRHAGIGNQRGRWKPVYGDFVKVWVATTMVFLVSMVAAVALIALVVGMLMGGFALFPDMKTMNPKVFVFILLLVLGFVFLMFFASAPARAYREARMFQLVWSNVGFGQVARFRCTLKTSSYVLLRLKNMLLTLLTLGLYRPFAKLSEYRMKVESVTLFVKGGLDQLVGQLVKQQGGLGDALADAAGLDLIG